MKACGGSSLHLRSLLAKRSTYMGKMARVSNATVPPSVAHLSPSDSLQDKLSGQQACGPNPAHNCPVGEYVKMRQALSFLNGGCGEGIG